MPFSSFAVASAGDFCDRGAFSLPIISAGRRGEEGDLDAGEAAGRGDAEREPDTRGEPAGDGRDADLALRGGGMLRLPKEGPPWGRCFSRVADVARAATGPLLIPALDRLPPAPPPVFGAAAPFSVPAAAETTPFGSTALRSTSAALGEVAILDTTTVFCGTSTAALAAFEAKAADETVDDGRLRTAMLMMTFWARILKLLGSTLFSFVLNPWHCTTRLDGGQRGDHHFRDTDTKASLLCGKAE